MGNFDDDEMKHAKMPLYTFGCCSDHTCPQACDGIPTPMCQWWEMTQNPDDPDRWYRGITMWCKPWEEWEMGSYELVRIIDENGNRLQPQFDDMMRQLEEGY